MVEIAIAIGVIGFALVAIVGILPRGLNVQKDNREETIISQDGPYIMDAIRNGQQGLDFLTNYVDYIQIKKISNNQVVVSLTSYPNTDPSILWNGDTIIGALSTPKYEEHDPGWPLTNIVTAHVRALNGSAMMQNSNNVLTAFNYLLTAEIIKFQYSQTNAGHANVPTNISRYAEFLNTNLPPTDPANLLPVAESFRMKELATLRQSLYEIRLTFQWPLLHPSIVTDNSVGPGIHQFRAMISGGLRTNNNSGQIFFQPQIFRPTP